MGFGSCQSKSMWTNVGKLARNGAWKKITKEQLNIIVLSKKELNTAMHKIIKRTDPKLKK